MRGLHDPQGGGEAQNISDQEKEEAKALEWRFPPPKAPPRRTYADAAYDQRRLMAEKDTRK